MDFLVSSGIEQYYEAKRPPQRTSKVAKAKGETFIITEGGNHSKVQIGSWSEPIPKHREIAENLARAIIRRSQQ